MDRRQKLLDGCAVHSERGIEFGPLANPLVSKEEGPIFYLDYTSAENLRLKSAADPNVDASAIVDVDFNLEEGSLTEICGPSAPFCYVVASHVFEHLPNPMGWLREISALIRPGGIVSLAIPDRRYTYDYFRSTTTCAQLVANDRDQLSRPSSTQLADHFFNVRVVDTVAAWSATPLIESCDRYHPDAQVLYLLDLGIAGQYMDCHCTVWTMEQFEQVFPEAVRLLDLPFTLRASHAPATYSNEFIVQLQRN